MKHSGTQPRTTFGLGRRQLYENLLRSPRLTFPGHSSPEQTLKDYVRKIPAGVRAVDALDRIPTGQRSAENKTPTLVR